MAPKGVQDKAREMGFASQEDVAKKVWRLCWWCCLNVGGWLDPI